MTGSLQPKPTRKRMLTFERKLTDAMAACGHTPKSLALTLGCDITTPYHWIHGRAYPTLDRLPELCRVLRVSPNFLFDWQEPAAQPAPDVVRALSPADVAKWGHENPAFLRPSGKRVAT